MDRRSWRVGRRLVRSLRNSPQGPEECIGKQLRIDPGNEFKHGDRLLRFPLLVEKFWKLAIYHSMNDDEWEEEVKCLWFLKFHLWCCHAGKVKSECSVDGFAFMYRNTWLSLSWKESLTISFYTTASLLTGDFWWVPLAIIDKYFLDARDNFCNHSQVTIIITSCMKS